MEKCTMKLHVRFTREIDKKKDYLSPGGFEMVMNGKQVQFDFVTSYGNVSERNHDIFVFELIEPDIDAFPGFKDVTVDDIRNISKIVECFVYTGEDDESDLEVKAIERIIFFLPDDDKSMFEVPKEIIDKFNAKARIEGSGMNWGGIKNNSKQLKLSPLSVRITKAPKDFISRFLDITVEDLDKYSDEQIGQMVESTVEQMPVEELKQFQIELNGGKREF